MSEETPEETSDTEEAVSAEVNSSKPVGRVRRWLLAPIAYLFEFVGLFFLVWMISWQFLRPSLGEVQAGYDPTFRMLIIFLVVYAAWRLLRWRAPSAKGASPLLAVFGACMMMFMFFLVIFNHHDYSPRGSDENDMKQLGLSFKMYAVENPDKVYPPLAPYEDLWTFDVRVMYPEYMSDLKLLISWHDPEREKWLAELDAAVGPEGNDWERVSRIAARRFVYVPWAVDEAHELQALARERRSVAPEDYDGDIPNHPSGGPFYRMREGVERFMLTDAIGPNPGQDVQGRIPLLIETGFPGTHDETRPPYGLFVDGSVRPVKDWDDRVAWDDVIAELYPDGMPDG
jgi:hypothetical protein